MLHSMLNLPDSNSFSQAAWPFTSPCADAKVASNVGRCITLRRAPFLFCSWIRVSVRYFLWWLAYICSSSNVLSLSKTWMTVETYSWHICLFLKVMYTGSRIMRTSAFDWRHWTRLNLDTRFVDWWQSLCCTSCWDSKAGDSSKSVLDCSAFLKHDKLFCGHFVPAVVLRCNTAVFHEMPGIPLGSDVKGGWYMT